MSVRRRAVVLGREPSREIRRNEGFFQDAAHSRVLFLFADYEFSVIIHLEDQEIRRMRTTVLLLGMLLAVLTFAKPVFGQA